MRWSLLVPAFLVAVMLYGCRSAGVTVENPASLGGDPLDGGGTNGLLTSPAVIPDWSALSNLLQRSGARTHAAGLPAGAPVEVPLEIEQNRPFFSVRVNGSRPRRFLFDTGTVASFIGRKAAAELGLLPKAAGSAGASALEGRRGVRLEIGAATYLPRFVFVDARESERRLTDIHFEGVLGCDVLEEYVIELDYRARKLRLRNPAAYKHVGAGDNLLILFDSGRPYIDATILGRDGRKIRGLFLIDTGATGSIYLGKKFADAHGLEAAAGPLEVGRSVRYDGMVENRIGHFASVQLGHYVVENPEVTFESDHRFKGELAGLIGGGLLRHFKVVFHYGRQQLTLEPNGTKPRPGVSAGTGSRLLD